MNFSRVVSHVASFGCVVINMAKFGRVVRQMAKFGRVVRHMAKFGRLLRRVTIIIEFFLKPILVSATQRPTLKCQLSFVCLSMISRHLNKHN